MALGTARMAQTSMAVRYPWRVLVWVSALVAGLFLLAQPSAEWSAPARLALRVALAAAYVPGLFLVGVYRRDDVDRAVSLMREHAGSTAEAGDAGDR
jgi:hypothetical protein